MSIPSAWLLATGCVVLGGISVAIISELEDAIVVIRQQYEADTIEE